MDTRQETEGAYLLAVLLDPLDMLLIALGVLFLLNGRDDPPRCTASANDILVRHTQQITLLHLVQSSKRP